VVKEAGRFVAVRVDCTHEDEGECAVMEERYAIPGLPRVLFFDSEGKLREELTVQGEVSPEEFLERMRAL
jgi:thiol:disulfide interchange protein